MDGVDFSSHLLAVAKARAAGGAPRYRQADMRALPASWSGRFDAVLNLGSSFGFFREPADDRRAVQEFARVLRPGGVVVWHGASRDGVMARFLSRDWWPIADGTLIAHERTFDPLSGVLSVGSRWQGRDGPGTRSYRLRLYTATRMAELLADVGVIVEEAFDGWAAAPLTRRSSEMLLVGRKRELPRVAAGG